MAGFGPDGAFKLQLATDEAFTNIVEHAYGGETAHGRVAVFCWVEGGFFIIQLRDQGRKFDPTQVPPHQPTNYDNPEVGGLGLHLIRQIVDDLQYSVDPLHGNILTMRKQLPTAVSSG